MGRIIKVWVDKLIATELNLPATLKAKKSN
jgi:hypothetical protein